MRNEGVTILQIVITVIIMLIIMSVAVLFGQGIAREARIGAIYNEIQEIESSLKEARLLNELKISGDSISIFKEITVPKVNAADYTVVLNGETSDDYYYLDFTTSRKLENTLELGNVDNDYLLDFKNLNIYLIEGISVSETIIEGTEEKVVDVVKYNSDEIADYYNDTFVK